MVMTHSLMENMNFCTDVAVPTKTVCLFNSNKPWVKHEVRAVFNKKEAFMTREKEAMKAGKDVHEGGQGGAEEEQWSRSCSRPTCWRCEVV